MMGFAMISDSNEDEHPLLKFTAVLQGKRLIVAMDTAATISVLSNRKIKQFDTELSEEIPICLADGSMTTAPRTGYMPFSLAGKNDEMRFVVTNLSVVDILIGLDWMVKHNVWINPKNNALAFISEYIPGLDMSLTAEQMNVCMIMPNKNQFALTYNEEIVEPQSVEELLEDSVGWAQWENKFTVDKDLQENWKQKLGLILTNNLNF